MSRAFQLLPLLILASHCDVPRAPKPVSVKEADAGQADAGTLTPSAECTGCVLVDCVEEGRLCLGDAPCQDCIANVLAPHCATNEFFLGLAACSCAKCLAPCADACEAFGL